MFPILNSIVEGLIKLVPNHKQSILFEGTLFKYCAEKGAIYLQVSPGAGGALAFFKKETLWNKSL